MGGQVVVDRLFQILHAGVCLNLSVEHPHQVHPKQILLIRQGDSWIQRLASYVSVTATEWIAGAEHYFACQFALLLFGQCRHCAVGNTQHDHITPCRCIAYRAPLSVGACGPDQFRQRLGVGLRKHHRLSGLHR